MIDYADKSFLRGVSSERIRLGFMDLKRRQARKLLKDVILLDFVYTRSECTDVRKTFARNMGLPS